MKPLTVVAMWVLCTLFFAALAALCVIKDYPAFALSGALVAVVLALLTWDEIKHYRKQRNKPQLQPLTQLDKT